MKSIWKFPIQITDKFAVVMPQDAEILSVQMQHGQPQLWALCNLDAPEVATWFRLFGTGHRISDEDYENLEFFIGTFQLDHLVFHLFRCAEARG